MLPPPAGAAAEGLGHFLLAPAAAWAAVAAAAVAAGFGFVLCCWLCSLAGSRTVDATTCCPMSPMIGTPL